MPSKEFSGRVIYMAIRVRWISPPLPYLVRRPSEPFRPLPVCTMFGKGHVRGRSEERQHRSWPWPCPGAGRLLRAVGHREELASCLHGQPSSPSWLPPFLLTQNKMLFGQNSRPWLPLFQYPMDPGTINWNSGYLENSQTFRLCPSPNLPTSLASSPNRPHTTNLAGVCFSRLQFFACLNPKRVLHISTPASHMSSEPAICI